MRILFTLLFLTNFLAKAQKTNSFLNITFQDSLELPNKATLQLSSFHSKEWENANLTLQGKSFVFEKDIAEPLFAKLDIYWKNNKRYSIRFLLLQDTGSIVVGRNNQVAIKFSNERKLFSDFKEMEQAVAKLKEQSRDKIKKINFENRLTNQIQKEIDSIETHYESVIDNNIYKRIFNNDRKSFVGVLAFMNYAERPTSHQRRKFQRDSLLEIFESFSTEMKELPTMHTFHELLISEKQLDLGLIFPNLKSIDTSYIQRELKDYYGEKYTLIDIWASWCTPCRSEHPILINQYGKYKDRGLNIISISIDKRSDTSLWKDAIKKDKIDLWPHFIDLEGEIYKNLKIRYIPANFLIDSKGIIIAKYLRGIELEKKLKEIFNK